ncbi:MAG TPA: energy-coupling factor transporter transmembrane component T [Chloroflexota bacterium]|nr:energy-coupling factor transporter transmembrane component T [Chloroflexota bacterium]
MKIFLFDEGDSFLHRLNPLTKLFAAVVVFIALTAIVDPVTPLLITALTFLAIWLLGRVRLGLLVRTLSPIVVLSFGLVWSTVLFYQADPGSHPRILGQVGPFPISDQAIAYACVIAFRMLGFFTVSLFFVLTTDPSDLVQALIQRLGLSYRFGYGAHAAYRFVPLFDSELTTIRAAHRVRGVRGGGPSAQIRQYIGFVVPLLASAIRRAERVALAMEARGFGASSQRTYYRRSTFGFDDLQFASGSVIAFGGALVLLSSLGWLGQLIPPFIK